MALRNTMEDIVKDKIDELIKDSGCCTCPKCREDIECIALNALPPRYVSTTKGQLYSRIAQTKKKQGMVDVDIACLHAIELVKANPQHDE